MSLAVAADRQVDGTRPTAQATARAWDVHRSPFIVIWEVTQACDLACRHCRAAAQPVAPPSELSTSEGCALIDEIADLGAKILVLSGGDPLSRADLPDLLRHGKARGLRMATIPAATPRLTAEAVQRLRAAGVDQLAFSLDASTAQAHDAFRGVPGAFARTLEAIGWARASGVPVQVNTVLSGVNRDELPALIALVSTLGIVFWEVFFLVPIGRGAAVPGLTSEEYEQAFAALHALARRAPFMVKVTEAPHYRRFCAQQASGARAAPEPGGLPALLRRPHGPGGSIGFSPVSVNAGKGHVFISSTGEIYPSGFLPLAAGNVRRDRLAAVYRDAPLFRALRDPDRLTGRCGLCEYRALCGGSRSRAYAITGDYLGEEPCCAYLPQAWRAGA